MFLLGDVDVGARWARRLGGTASVSVVARYHDWIQVILSGDFALSVVEPVDLACTHLPLCAQDGLKLGLGQARRKASTDELQTRLGSFGAAGSLAGWILL